jgi:uncharacterized protein YbjT (DUF2867 family)
MNESPNRQVVAVHGATGTQGARVAARLAGAGYDVRPLSSRNADLTSVESLLAAYQGVDAVVVHLPQVFDPVTLVQSESVVAALAKAGVARAVFNPGMPLPPGEVGLAFVDARVAMARQIAEAVPTASVIGPAGPYLENLTQPWSVRRIVTEGEVAYPLPEIAPVPWVTLDDIGDLIAATLGAPEPAQLQVVSGPEPMTGSRLAAAVGEAVGRELRYVEIAADEFRRRLEPVVGPEAAAGIASFYDQPADSPAPPLLPPTVAHAGPTSVARWASVQDWA